MTLPAAPQSAENGFTLVELMVSLFIFGLIAVAGVSLLTFSVRAQASASARLDDMAQDRRLSALLTSDLAQALPRISRALNGDPVRAFAGTDGSRDGLLMGYVRAGWSNPDSSARAGIQRVDIVLDKGRIERRAYPMTDGTMPATTILLADNVESVGLRYREKAGWRPAWDTSRLDQMPRAVELTIKRKAHAALLTAFLVGTAYP
ncbi:type II secretion system protein GspJ [Sphingomonas paeninsulae]|uniref:Type II secretion system protein J n=1 Tax=Sphingomonas paeninsulae TaxID=2319844 RepID=A0A494TIN6_SPHPE|nr:type II secretion system minor pseudopilin GspJ [Sphingomonas paeninsulae]AYJ85676.1 type II secretion system protein GspJ [Sphingomonas paeninsulae]